MSWDHLCRRKRVRAQKVLAQGAMTAAAASFLACSAASTALCAASSLRNLQRATKPLMCACGATNSAQVTVLHLKATTAEGKGLSTAQNAMVLPSMELKVRLNRAQTLSLLGLMSAYLQPD